MNKWILLIISILPFSPFSVFAKTLEIPVYIFEIKPLVYQEDHVIKGPWYDQFEKLSQVSQVKFNYQFVSISRLELMLSGTKPGCNLTLLKTKERLDKKIDFIFDHPKKSLIKIYYRSDDERDLSIKGLQKEKYSKIVTNTPAAVNALKELNIPSELLFNLNSIVRMLILKRIDVLVASNLAIEKMEEFKSGKISRGEMVKSLDHGIGCSRGTSPEIVTRLRDAARNWQLEVK